MSVSKKIRADGDYLGITPILSQQAVTDRAMARPSASFTVGRAHWFALQVRTDRAFKVRDALRDAGIDEFLATYEETTRWSDRTKTSIRQLFPGYVFARVGVGREPAVLALPGVLQLLPTNLHPIAIPDDEIAALRAVIASKLPAVRCPYVAGNRVTIESGPLAGVSGVVVKTRDETRIVVGVEMLGRAVSVEIEAADLTKC